LCISNQQPRTLALTAPQMERVRLGAASGTEGLDNS
jgi:hypothetical protein